MSEFLERFAATVSAHTDRVAILTDGSEALTYAELQARAIQRGRFLRQRGIGPETVVGLCLEKSADYLIALLGAWYAGGAFVPMDPTLPPERLAFIAQESGITVMLGRPEMQLPCSARDSADPLGPATLAYIIYTSGSTGTPKGVLIEHKGIVNFLDAQIPLFGLRPGCRALFYLSTSFDASISDIGTALLSGATLCIERPDRLQPGPDLIDLLHTRRITHVDIPPAVLPLLDPETLPECLETIIIGGEPCPPEVVRRWARRVHVVNVYGPTEATVCTSLGLCHPDTWEAPLLGRPIPNISYHLLDENGDAVPPGTPGELCIGGVGLARGYLNRPELTARKFIVHEGERLYRTADRVVLRSDGEYQFLGRVDRQVKVRGMLIEPEEIETQLLNHPQVLQVAVVKRSLGRRMHQGLAAFVVARSEGIAPSALELRRYLARSLPCWMLPQRFEFLSRLPVNAHGKVDLADLAVRELSIPSEVSSTLVGEARLLAEAVALVLGTGPVDLAARFVELGGDSLAALETATAAAASGLLLSPAELMLDQPLEQLLQGQGRDTVAMSADQLRQGWASDAPVGSLATSATGAAPVAEVARLPTTTRQEPRPPCQGWASDAPVGSLATSATGAAPVAEVARLPTTTRQEPRPPCQGWASDAPVGSLATSATGATPVAEVARLPTTTRQEPRPPCQGWASDAPVGSLATSATGATPVAEVARLPTTTRQEPRPPCQGWASDAPVGSLATSATGAAPVAEVARLPTTTRQEPRPPCQGWASDAPVGSLATSATGAAPVAEVARLPTTTRQEPRPPCETILLTGATGFLGARLLGELLQRTDAEIHCLVRAEDATIGRQRILSALRGHEMPLSSEQLARIIAVPGDLEKPDLGLSSACWQSLAATVDTIHHCAARVNMVLPYSALQAANVEGTRAILRLAGTGRPKWLHYASTLSVFVATDRNTGRMDESDDLRQTKIVHGGYAQTKWAAEVLLRQARAGTGPGAIYRLGLITGASNTGYCSDTDFLSLFCRGVVALGCVPDVPGDTLKVDVTPVDYAAAALAWLSLHSLPSSGLRTFHIANAVSLTLGELIAALRDFGLPIKRLPEAEWCSRAAGNLNPETSAAYLALCRSLGDQSAAFARYRTLDLFQATGTEFGMDNTRTGLLGSGITCPPPDRALLRTYLGRIFAKRP